MAVGYGNLVGIEGGRVHCHAPQGPQASRVPEQIIILQKLLLRILRDCFWINKLCFLNAESRPLVALLRDHRILFDQGVLRRLATMDKRTD